MQNSCRDRDDVPAGVGKNSGICLRTLYCDRFTRISWHCVRNRCWNTQFSRINPVGICRSNLEPVQKPLHRAKGQPNRGKKFLVVEWLRKKSRRASFQRGGTHERIFFSGKHDDARGRRKLLQSRLNLESVHERHPNINDGNRRPMNLHVTQKRLWLAELFRLPACRDEKPIEASQHRRIIVEKTDPIWAWSKQNK